VLIPTGRPNYPSSYSGAPVANDLVIESGASVTIETGFDMNLGGNVYVNTGGTLAFGPSIAAVTPKLFVAGNWVMNGTVTPNQGEVSFDGATAQTLQGTTNFFSLNINNSNGASVTSGMMYVGGGLELDLGTFTTNNLVTIKSSATGTGWVDNFSPGMTGTLSGDIIMQRFFAAAAQSTAFHYISSPVNNANVATQLSELSLYGPNGGQVVPFASCDPNNVSPGSPYGSLFEWREDASFLFSCNQSGWHVRSSGTLTNGRGYAGVVRRNTDFTLDVKGTANTGTVAYNSLDNTTAIGDGWHLVSNPYPSPIEWNVPSAGFIGAAHFWQSSGSYTGTYQPQLSGTGYLIPSMQGFFIQTTGAGPTNFVLTNSDRRTGDATFNRQANWYDHILNVELAGNNFADRTTVYFGADCSDAFDNLYDAQKKESRAGQPTLYTRIANYPKLVGINGLPTDDSKVVSVPMGLIAGTAGTYTFTFADMNTFGASALIFLEDTKTGAIQNMRANDTYTFTSTLSDDPERFIIHFYPPAAITTADGDCEGLNGTINVDLGVFNVGGTQLTWDSYELTDANGTVISSNTNVNGTISMVNIPAGSYGLNLEIQGYQTSETIIIGAPAPVDAAYAAGFSQAYTQAILEFLNQSVNATDYSWSFGDGATSNLSNPTHIYTQPGIYDVTLVANSDDCSDTYTSKVEVLEVAVGLPNTPDANPMVNISSYQDVITLGFLNLKDPSVQVDIFDLSGRKIIETLSLETSQSSHQIKMTQIASGYYFVRVTGADTYADKKIFLTSDN
jgi:PKD repeat protein